MTNKKYLFTFFLYYYNKKINKLQMEVLDDLFSKDQEIVDKLKENAMILDYKKIFFEHLGPELNKLFEAKKNKIIIKNFLEACQYEYGFFNKEIDLERAFALYKK